ncbi:gins3 [Symbiodinium natans]|uniref:Gins3 protein n=1 Tax=Symbiodinium natans TaxID=878477 RepID=A0A812QII2_9DINO|nr:gins3 [Symbiodinium natans]
MPARTRDYWDIDEILAEEYEVMMTSFYNIIGGGVLYPNSGGSRPRDLKAGFKVCVPLGLARKLALRDVVDIELPAHFGEEMQESLRVDPLVCRLGEKSPYYFEAGMKIASLLKQPALEEILMEAFRRRWVEIVTLTPSHGETLSFNPVKDPVHSFFPHTLTAVEEDFSKGSKEAETCFRKYLHKFTHSNIEVASHLVDLPESKRARV